MNSLIGDWGLGIECHREDGGNDSQHANAHLTTILEELHQWE